MRNVLRSLLDRVVLGDSPRRRLVFAKRMPQAYIRQTQHTDFRSTVSRAAHGSTFYRRRFHELGIDPGRVSCPADLGDLFTTAEDLVNHPIEDFLCDRPNACFETTGTSSSRRKRLCFSLEEMNEMGRNGATGLWSLGVRPDDRMVSAFDLPFWNAGAAIRSAASSLGCFFVETGMMPPAEFYDRAADYRFTVLVAEPSWLVRLSELAEQRGTWPVKLMLAGGEDMSGKARRYVEHVWKTDVYLTYGQTESFGGAGTECFHKQGYHLNELAFWFEIPEPGEDGNGEVVLTTLSRAVMPLLRYRTSDVARFLPDPCGCDFTSLRRLSRIVGRCDEIVNCGLGHISPWVFDQVLDRLPGVGSEWQVVVSRPELREVIDINIEQRAGAPVEVIERQIVHSLSERFPEMAHLASIGLCELRVRVHPPGTLRAGRKLRAVVDLRGSNSPVPDSSAHAPEAN